MIFIKTKYSQKKTESDDDCVIVCLKQLNFKLFIYLTIEEKKRLGENMTRVPRDYVVKYYQMVGVITHYKL